MTRLTKKEDWDAVWGRNRKKICVDLSDPYDRRFHDILVAHLPKGKDISFMEVGCGSGKWLHYYSTYHGYSVVGIDYSERSCQASRFNIDGLPTSALVVRADVDYLPFKTQVFDVIFSGGFLEHFTNPADVFGRIATLVKPGGLLITTVPNLKSFYWPIQKWVDPELFHQHRLITLEDLGQFYKRSGLDIELLRYLGTFDLFSVNWSALETSSKTFCRLLPWLKRFNAVMKHAAILTGLDVQARRISPFILAIGKKAI